MNNEFRRLRRFWVRLVVPARHDRLDGSLHAAENEIAHRFHPNRVSSVVARPPGEVRPETKDTALSLLREGRAALALGKIDQGWKLLHAARRMEILGLGDSELSAFAAVLRAESGKLKEWRRKAIEAILKAPPDPASVKAPPDAASVSLAALIRDEHYDNQGYKDQLIRAQILFLALILGAVMTGIMSLAYIGHLPMAAAPVESASGTGTIPAPASRSGHGTFLTLLAVMLFGNLGGTISAMLRAPDPMASTRIPEIMSTNRLTLMRILMGGASAVIIHLVLQSQLMGVFNHEFAKTMTSLKPQTTYVVAFVAGFTERLVLSMVDYVAGKSTTAESDKAKSAT